MAVDRHGWDTSLLPSQFLLEEDDDFLSHSQHKNNSESDLRPLVHSTEAQRNDKDEDFIAELTRHMDRFMLQDDDSFDSSSIGSRSPNLELSWDLIGSPQSILWSPLGSNQGSSEGSSSSQEASPPATPGDAQDSCNWNRLFEKMKLEEGGNSKCHPGYEIQNFKTSYQSLIQEQIRAIELSWLKQEQVPSMKQKQTESQGRASQQSDPKGQIKQSQKKCKGGGNGRKTRPPRPAPPPPPPLQSQQQAGAGMRALFLSGSGSRGGTGVFFPRAGTTAPPESTKKQGNGCSTVLIPARVLQALQLHFDQMAATSGPKAGCFPPLHDVLVSNMDGMYSLEKRQSRKAPANIQNEMILPQEWTY